MADLYSWVDSSGYSWSDEPYIQWAILTGTTLNQVWQDADYAYLATSKGLDIISMELVEKVAYIPWHTGFSTVWASDDIVYLGTNTGVKYLSKSSILEDGSDPINLIPFLNTYTYFNPTSENINYIHGYSNKLSIVTTSGMDLVDNTSNGFKSSTLNSNIHKCFSTAARSVYYTVNGSGTNGIFKINSYLFDWVTPDVSYITGDSFLPPVTITDLFVTLGTASSGVGDTLFVATSSGVYVFDEDSGQATHYTNTLAGTSVGIVGIWADVTSSSNSGKMYIVSSGVGAAFSIYDLTSDSLLDKYTLTEKGSSGQVLLSEDIIDIGGN